MKENEQIYLKVHCHVVLNQMAHSFPHVEIRSIYFNVETEKRGGLVCVNVSLHFAVSCTSPKKYVNIPSEKYIYVHKYVYICVYTYLCKMDEHRSYGGLSEKWMSTGLMLACHKNG